MSRYFRINGEFKMKKLLIVAATTAALTISGSAFAINTLNVAKDQMLILNEVANIMVAQTSLSNYSVLGNSAADTFSVALYNPQAAAGNPGYGYVSVTQTNYATTGAFTLTLDGSSVYPGLEGTALTFAPVGPNDVAFDTGVSATMNSSMGIHGWGCTVTTQNGIDSSDQSAPYGTLAAFKSKGSGSITYNLITDNAPPAGIPNLIALCNVAS